jgi:peptide/nickel transport system permease protein
VSVSATSQGDIPMVMGLVMAVGTIVILVNLAIDILHGFLNPKARLS